MINFLSNNTNPKIPKVRLGSKLRRNLCIAASAPLMFSCVSLKTALPTLPERDQIKWNDNIKVTAAVGQNNYGEYDAYCPALLRKHKTSQSIEKSASELTRNYGYHGASGESYFAVETPKELGVYNKKDTAKNRFAILINGFEEKRSKKVGYSYGEAMFAYSCDNLKKLLKGEYNLPDSNIYRISVPDLVNKFRENEDSVSVIPARAFRNVLDSISERVKKLNDYKNTEVLIYYSGHGIAANEDNLDTLPDVDNFSNSKFHREAMRPGKYEGSYEGLIDIGFESDVKKTLNENPVLQKIKGILFINDSCHSGAWIAKAKKVGKNLAKKAMNLVG